MAYQRPPFNPDSLTAARLATGLSRAAVAEQLGVSRSRVHAWERGDNAPLPRHLTALAKVLGITPTSLVEGSSLRSRRYAAGLTQAEASTAVGVDRAEWSRWESGLRIPHRHADAVERLVGG
ncbi:MAG: helix-turn-helix transcriptional regulator [bacterium]|nr:helix-turn-helix transcriptional regulator [bacterium]MDE0287544.1 helix-turn-helix transcriptional regulator [bacterium]MDE0437681.1 helix-turn-helix transcriptional regulator [bacterium]